MNDQSPAPVAGAVDPLTALILEAKSYVTDLANWREDDSEQLHEAAWQSALMAIDRLAALHPQPAPAVAVEAERELFEAYFAASRRNKGVAKRPTFHRLEDDTYSDDHTQRHWWTWQNALAARSAPAVAEKVPLTEGQILAGWGHKDAIAAASASRDGSAKRELERQLEVFTAGVRYAEQAHGIGSGSAQEGQAK